MGSSETVVISASKTVAGVILGFYVLGSFVVAISTFGWGASVLFLAGWLALGFWLYRRFTAMRLTVDDHVVRVVNFLEAHELDTATAKVISDDVDGFWSDGQGERGDAKVLTLTDASKRQVRVAVAPTFGTRYRSVIEDFNIALAQRRLSND